MLPPRYFVRAAVSLSLSGVAAAQTPKPLDTHGPMLVAFDAARDRALGIGRDLETLESFGGRWQIRGVPTVADLVPLALHFETASGRCLLVGRDPQLHYALRRFDGAGWVTVPANAGPNVRGAASIAYDRARSELLVFGGEVGFTASAGDTWIFDGVTWRQRLPVHSPPPRSAAVAAFDSARSRVVLFGGNSALIGGSLLDDTWEWDGQDWTQVAPVARPPATMSAALCCDETRQRIVLFGGLTSRATPFASGDTWEYDGTTWQARVANPGGPGGRQGAQLYFDRRVGRVVMGPGRDSSGWSADSWSWDGATWQPAAVRASAVDLDASSVRGLLESDPLGAPILLDCEAPTPVTWRWTGSEWRSVPGINPPSTTSAASCSGPQFAYVYGGIRAFPIASNELWGFDGVAWRQLANGPGDRFAANLEYDWTSGRLLVFGGQSFQRGTLGDTSVFDGVSWSTVQPATTPPARSGARMAFAFGRGLIMHGGVDASGAELFDTWEWNGNDWNAVASTVVPTGATAMAFDASRGRVLLMHVTANIAPVAWTLEQVGWQPVPGLTAGVLAANPSGLTNVLGGLGRPGLLLRHDDQMLTLSVREAELQTLGVPCTGAAPRVSATHWPRPGTADLAIDVVGVPSAPVLLLAAASRGTTTIGGCALAVGAGPVAVLLVLSATGFASQPLPIPARPALRGAELFLQTAALDSAQPSGFTLSAGLRCRVGD